MSRLMPITDWIVLIAATPSQPAERHQHCSVLRRRRYLRVAHLMLANAQPGCGADTLASPDVRACNGAGDHGIGIAGPETVSGASDLQPGRCVHLLQSTQRMVSAPASRATRAGIVMSVTLGVILAHTGTVAFSLIQPHTSCRDEIA